MHLHTEASIRLNPKFSIKKAPFLWRLAVQRGILVLGDLCDGGHSFSCHRDSF